MPRKSLSKADRQRTLTRQLLRLAAIWAIGLLLLAIASFLLEGGGDWKKFVAHSYNIFTISSNLGEATPSVDSSYQVRAFGSLLVNVVAILIGLVVVAKLVALLTGARAEAEVHQLVEAMREEVFDDHIDRFRKLRIQASRATHMAHDYFDEIVHDLADIAAKRTRRAAIHRVNIHEFETIFRHCLYRMEEEHGLCKSHEGLLRHVKICDELTEIRTWVERELMGPPALLREHLEPQGAGELPDEKLVEAWKWFRELPDRILKAQQQATQGQRKG